MTKKQKKSGTALLKSLTKLLVIMCQKPKRKKNKIPLAKDIRDKKERK